MKKYFPYFFLIIITCISFAPALVNQFTNWDDGALVTNNPHVQSLNIHSFKAIFTSSTLKTYIPLTILSFSLERFFFGFDPFVFHFNNLLLHVFNVLLIFYFAKQLKLSRMVAFIGALIFAIHPMHVESVAWVSERKDVLYSFLYLLSLIYYLKYFSEYRKKYFVLTWIFGLLSILAKPMALSLPLILFVIDWYMKRQWSKGVVVEKLWIAAYCVPIGLITYIQHARWPIQDLFQSLLIWVWSFSFYIIKFLCPAFLSPLYKLEHPISITNPVYLVSAVVFIIIIFSLKKFKHNRIYCFALMYYFFSIFFLLRFDSSMDKTLVADRFMYLPSLGICLFLAYGIENLIGKVKEKQKVFQVSLMLSLGLLFFAVSVKTYQQSSIWRTSEALWSYVIENSSHQSLAFQNRGAQYLENNQLEKSLADFNYALSLDQNLPDVFYNRGIVHHRMKKHDLAIMDFNRAIKLNPYISDYYNNRGVVLKEKSSFNEAYKDFSQAIKLNGSFRQAYMNRGILAMIKNDVNQAIKDFSKALELKEDKQAFKLRAGAYHQNHDTVKAQLDFFRSEQIGN